VDSVAGLLDGPRARDAFLLRSLLEPPWSLRIEDRAPLSLVAVAAGQAYLTPTTGAPVWLRPGDVAVLRGPDDYTVADRPDREPTVRILPGQRCVPIERPAHVTDPTPAADPTDCAARPMIDLGVRTWGNSPDGDTALLTGTYQFPGETSRRLLTALPAALTVCATDWPGGRPSLLINYLAEEIVRDEPGQEAVLDRLLDLLLIAVLRAWFARPEAAAPGWYSAHGDPIVGPALRLLHHEPAYPWSVAELARRVGISRAAFARRFTDLVGATPMAFLTEWRLTLAADLLREPGATISSVAHQVGYASPYALSTAFKRVRGISPREHRARAG
jgi:AraC-like DNA-binding protein